MTKGVGSGCALGKGSDAPLYCGLRERTVVLIQGRPAPRTWVKPVATRGVAHWL